MSKIKAKPKTPISEFEIPAGLPKKHEEVLLALKAGESATQVARTTGISISYLYAIIASQNVSIEGNRAKPTGEAIDDLHKTLGYMLLVLRMEYAHRKNPAFHDRLNMARAAGITAKRMASIEMGAVDVGYGELRKIATVYELSVSELFKKVEDEMALKSTAASQTSTDSSEEGSK